MTDVISSKPASFEILGESDIVTETSFVESVYTPSTYGYKRQDIKTGFQCLHWYRRPGDLIGPCSLENLFHRGFAAPYVINDFTVNVVKRSCLALGLEKKICLIGRCFLSDSFHCIF